MGTLFGRLRSYFTIKHAILLIPVCGFAVYDSVFQAFASILGVLHTSYPDIPVTVLQMVIALPPLMSIPGTLLSGLLSSYVHNKYIAEFALGVIFVGGMIPVIVPDPTVIALFICSGCIGVGQGLLHPLANAIICQRWTDDAERSKALGFKQAFNYIGEVIVTMAIGFLALSHWGNAFLVYLGVIPVFLVTLICLPKDRLDAKLVDRKDHFAGIKELFTPKVVYLLVLFAVAAIFLYGYYTNIALLVQERHLGTTADVAGISSTISIVSCLLGISYGVVSKKLGRFTLAAGYAVLATGMFVISGASSLAMVVVGGVLLGFGVGIQQISTIFYISKAASPKVVTLAVSFALVSVALGYSAAPIVLEFLQVTFTGFQSAGAGLLVSGVGYVALTVIEGLHSRKTARDERLEEPPGSEAPAKEPRD